MSNKTVTAEDLLAEAGWAQRLARCLVQEDADADDLLQETWIAATGAGLERGTLRPWLRKVLKNRAYNRSRDERRRRDGHQAAAAEATATVPAPDELLARMQLQRLLAEEVCALAEPLRQTVLLRFYEGLTSADIARALAVPAGTVRWRLKQALDELRTRLDTRHGKRGVWVPLLAPMLRSGTEPAPIVEIGLFAHAVGGGLRTLVAALTVSTAIGAGAWLWSRHRPRGAGEAQAGSAFTGGQDNRPRTNDNLGHPRFSPDPKTPVPATALPLPNSALDCQRRLLQVRSDAAAMEEQYRNVARHEDLFADGQPNPVAQQVLTPFIEDALSGWLSPSILTFECRTWACKGTVLHSWWQRFSSSDFSRHPTLKDRVRRVGMRSGNRTDDSWFGWPARELTFFVGLASPSGEPVPPGAPTPLPEPDSQPLSDELDPCRRDLSAEETRLARMRQIIRDDPSPLRGFERGTLDSALTERFQQVVTRILDPDDSGPKPIVECRGRACRVTVPGARNQNSWTRQLQRDPEARSWMDGPVVTGPSGLYLSVRDPNSSNGSANRSSR